ncbi:MAG: phosphatase PAP2 family protein [Deltaproteobacteria bacterium]|nr:phosphatase PAP2 family protein [Deltaproteobacteria bacterium]
MKNLNPLFYRSLAVLFILVALSYLFIDIPLAVYCRNMDAGVRNFFGVVTELGISTWYLIGSFALFLFFRFVSKQTINAQRALFFFVSIVISGILVNVVRFTAGRYRPEMLFSKGLYGFTFFEIEHALVSFPSGHTTTAFAIAMALSFFWRKYWPFFGLFALMVGVSRMIITAHYLSDVIAGAYVGIVSVIFLKNFTAGYWEKNLFSNRSLGSPDKGRDASVPFR